MATDVAPSAEYLALIQEFPLRPIRSDQELQAAIAMIDRVHDKDRSLQENDYLEVLAGLVEAYEDEHFPLPEGDPIRTLRFLLEENGITQTQLAEETGLALTTISEILNGKRSISPKARKALAERFGVCPSLFA